MQTSDMKFRIWNMVLVLALMLGTIVIASAPVQAQEGQNRVMLPMVIGEQVVITNPDLQLDDTNPEIKAAGTDILCLDQPLLGLYSGYPSRGKQHQQNYVRQLQTELNTYGYGLAVDGLYGPETDKAVNAFNFNTSYRSETPIVGKIDYAHLCHPTVGPYSRLNMVVNLWSADGSPTYGRPYEITDVPASNEPNHHAIQHAFVRGYTNGTSRTCYSATYCTYTFSPNAIMDRAQFVTMLYRHRGQPTTYTGLAQPFQDASPGSYYYEAAKWAYYTNVTRGIRFGLRLGPGHLMTFSELKRDHIN